MKIIFPGTLPETNIASENGWLEDEFPFRKAYFQVLLLLVSGRVCVFFLLKPPLSLTAHSLLKGSNFFKRKPGSNSLPNHHFLRGELLNLRGVNISSGQITLPRLPKIWAAFDLLVGWLEKIKHIFPKLGGKKHGFYSSHGIIKKNPQTKIHPTKQTDPSLVYNCPVFFYLNVSAPNPCHVFTCHQFPSSRTEMGRSWAGCVSQLDACTILSGLLHACRGTSQRFDHEFDGLWGGVP